MVHRDGLDQTLLLELPQSGAGQRTIDLEALDQGGRSDELGLGNLSQQTVVVHLLVKKHLVGDLLTHLALGPLLLGRGKGGGKW